MKNIVIITNGTLPLPPVNGGAAENLLQTFIDINEIENDFQLVVFSISNYKALLLAENFINSKFIYIDAEKLSFKVGRTIRYLLNRLIPNSIRNQFIYEVLKHKKYFDSADLVLIENNPYFSFHVRKITKKPIGLHLHNDFLNIDNLNFSKRVLKNLDFVIAVSEYIKSRVEKVKSNGCKVGRVYNGLKIDRFQIDDSIFETNKLALSYNIDKKDVVIVFAGRLQESKGVKVLIEVVIELLKLYNIKLLIIGSSGFSGSRKTKFIKQIEELSLSTNNKIVFTGYINYSEIHKVYNLADFAVFPSLAPEAFPLTPIEAQAASLPVILTDAGGMPETVNDKCGVVIRRSSNMKQELKAEIEKLILNKELRAQMSIEAKKNASQFNDVSYYQSMKEFLKSLTE